MSAQQRLEPHSAPQPRPFDRADEQFRLLVEAVRDYAIFMLDPEGRVVSWNAGAEAIKGYRAEEIVGQSFERFYLPGEVAAGLPRQHLVDACREGTYRETGERVRKDGSRFWADVVITALRDEAGALRGFAKVTRDITAQRNVIHELAESERRLRFTLASSQIGDWDLDLASGRFLASPEHWRILGYDAPVPGWSGERFAEHVHAEDRARVQCVVREAMARRAVMHYECRIVRRDGAVRWIEVHAAMRPGEGEHLSGVVHDITARKASEQEVRRLAATLETRVRERTAALAEANLEMQAFNYTVSHDLRAPLRGIRGFAQILLEDFSDALGDEGREYCRRMAAAGERMEQLIEDLLAYGRVARQELTLKAIEFGPVVAEALKQLEELVRESGAEVRVADRLPAVRGQRPLLVQSVQNLVGNALKFVAPGVSPRVAIQAERHAGRVRLYVADNGIGIAPEHRDRIFRVIERLHSQEQYPGTGIGLAIVRRAMERLGGGVGVEARESGGSRFWLELDAA